MRALIYSFMFSNQFSELTRTPSAPILDGVTGGDKSRALLAFCHAPKGRALGSRMVTSVKKINLFLENNDQYGHKKYFSTVVLLYDERIFIDILKNQPPNVNSYRKVLETCSKAVRPCR